MQKLQEKPSPASVDFLPLNGTDYVEFYVGNARQAAYYYRAAFGMQLTAYSGPETGNRGRSSYVVQQGKIRFVLTTPLQPDDPISQHIRKHGDGVRDIALWVDDAESTAKSGSPPSQFTVIPSTPSSSVAATTACFCRAMSA